MLISEIEVLATGVFKITLNDGTWFKISFRLPYHEYSKVCCVDIKHPSEKFVQFYDFKHSGSTISAISEVIKHIEERRGYGM